MVTGPRQIRRLESGFSQVDSVFHKNYTAGRVHGVRTRLCIFYGKRSRPGKTPTPNVGFGVGPLPSAKNKWHIHNALDAKITAGLVHNGERGFQMLILWLYNSSISQSIGVLPVLAVYVAAYPD